ncbi:MAG: Mov34/MPN/PAD-1 family protein [Methanobacterium sp. PtaB.Bin024]|jgi:proteasome lid subunit RPN8/RPN11|nr:MAG: Mov34/MPN/PAD-1 family protein [Methanobacterium sp. PtaB.Bin024]
MNEKKGWVDRIIGILLGNQGKDFQEILIDREVVDEIIQIARQSHPLEFMAMLEGKIHEGVLKVEGLVFLPGETSNQSAVMKTFMMPMTTETVGSVHSHPIPNATPSTADLHFFAKNGLFHLIIAQPYTEESMIGYDTFGEMINYRII